jgi:hypothetical protein
MGAILAYRERYPESNLRADAALSLQALLLQSERARVIAANRVPAYPVAVGIGGPNAFDEVPAEQVSVDQLGLSGIGHEFFIDDVPGGDDVTALVAFLLALDDEPGSLERAAPHWQAPSATQRSN